MRLPFSAVLFSFLPFVLFAAQPTTESLEGKWIFTHMILDGESERSVNRTMEFLSNGNVVNYDKAGNEESRASYVVKPSMIVYSDKKGDQNWKVIKYEGTSLQVNHLGADMFFEKQ
jgi:hypothetical protein